MASKLTEQLVIGNLLHNPLLLARSDKYILSVDDFRERVFQHIFYAVANLVDEGATKIFVQDIEFFMKNSPTGSAIFKAANGVELLKDAIELSNVETFDVYYSNLKKENLLEDLRKDGYDTKEFYEVNPITREQIKTNDLFNELTAQQIIDRYKLNFLKHEKKYAIDDEAEILQAHEGLDDLFEDLEQAPDVGLPLQGKIFNAVVAGARRGAFYVRSGASGVSKTRQSVGDACYLAYPIRYNQETCEWEQTGYNEKTLFVATEQSKKEIQLMILAYLTGLNEKTIKMKMFATEAEKKLMLQAKLIMETYDNLTIIKKSDPTIQSIKTYIREQVLLHDIGYVFYDYIFVGPALLNEFRGFNLRQDEALLMFSTALKDLAVELDLFILSSTQTNAKADDNKKIRDESSIAGARSIINKADVGCVMARPSNEELDILEGISDSSMINKPNIVTDLYKNRGEEMTQVRIWTYFDAGTLRKQDLFITNSRLEPIESFDFGYTEQLDFTDGLQEETEEMLKQLNTVIVGERAVQHEY